MFQEINFYCRSYIEPKIKYNNLPNFFVEILEIISLFGIIYMNFSKNGKFDKFCRNNLTNGVNAMAFAEIPYESEIHNLLNRLGITPNYLCFYQVVYAVHLASSQPELLEMVTKMLYPEVAKRCRCDYATVERNISAASKLAWRNNPQLLQALCGCELTRRPKPAAFLSILAQQIGAGVAAG